MEDSNYLARIATALEKLAVMQERVINAQMEEIQAREIKLFLDEACDNCKTYILQGWKPLFAVRHYLAGTEQYCPVCRKGYAKEMPDYR